MSEIFYKVLEMSLYGSIAILAVLLFRLVFKKCPKKIMILFWIIVALRLVIPFNFNSPTSALNAGKLFASKSITEETTVYDPETRLREITVVQNTQPEVTETISAVTEPAEPLSSYAGEMPETQQAVTVNTAEKITFKTVIPYIWLGVMTGLLVFSAIRYMLFYSKARWSSRSFDGRYYMANDIDSPFVVGVFSPKIFFPINMDDDEREYVLNHEWTHIKNKDGLTKLLSYIVLCIHWFNPLVWLAFFMLCADIEMRVDEETTSNFDVSMVKEYCKSLVRHAADDNKGAFMQSTAFSGLSFGGMETKIRIKNLLSGKITSTAVQIASIAVTLIFALLVSAASAEHQPWVMKTPEEPEETFVSESGVADETMPETSSSGTKEIYADYTEAYLSFVVKNGIRNANFKYDLLYIDGDDIPELVVDNFNVDGDDYKEQSLYVFRDGGIVPVYEGLSLDAYGSESYYCLPYDDNIIHSYLESDEKIICNRYTLDGLMEGNDPVITGHITDHTYFVESRQVEYDEFSKSFNIREAQGIFGSYTSLEFFDLLNGNLSDPGETADDPVATGETTEETIQTTQTSQTAETTQKKVSCFASLPDNTGLEISFENNNRVTGSFGTVGVDVYGNNTIGITVNDKFFICNALSYEYTCMYLVKDYGKAYIYIQFLYNGDNYISVYSIDDDGAVFVDSVANLILDEKITYPRTFRCIETYGPDATMDISRYYRMSENNGLPVPDEVRIASFIVKKPLINNLDLIGRVMDSNGKRTDEVMTIPAGSYAIPVKTDDHSYLDVSNSDGTVIRIEFSVVDNYFSSRKSAGALYDKVNTMFDPA